MDTHIRFPEALRRASTAAICAALALLVGLGVVGIVAAWLGDSATLIPPPARAAAASSGATIQGGLRLPPGPETRKRFVRT